MTEPPAVVVARKVLAAIHRAQALTAAITDAMVTAGQFGQVVPGWQQLQQLDAMCQQATNPHGVLYGLAANEVNVYDGPKGAA